MLPIVGCGEGTTLESRNDSCNAFALYSFWLWGNRWGEGGTNPVVWWCKRWFGLEWEENEVFCNWIFWCRRGTWGLEEIDFIWMEDVAETFSVRGMDCGSMNAFPLSLRESLSE